MNELLLKYNSLDAFGKQELMDFLEFLVQKRQRTDKKKYSGYKQKILKVSEWSESDIRKMQENAAHINTDRVS